MNKQQKIERARDLFLGGYNCSQSVAAAFAPEMGMDEKTVLRLASGMGGGVGGLRSACGAVTGMALVLGAVRGYDEPDDPEAKKHLYADIRRLGEAFMQDHGTIVCSDLLAKAGIQAQAEPSPRTPEYYRTRPCARYVEACAALLAEELEGDA